MTFRCRICGECCSHLGLVHAIREEYANHEYSLLNRYTGDVTRVSVDPDKTHLLDNMSIFQREPEACPFLRDDPDNHRVCCIVHATRPDICREFQCWRLLVLDSRGRQAGRVMGRRHLNSDDPVLCGVWEQRVGAISEPDDASWDFRVERVLLEAGYTVVRGDS
ncbi:MAG: YkgJ family cysteine cluster protein [Methanomicrobiales archaeon]|nr:YkgJ family cysteine cluster protein [Methanomicrobiales archaeon]